jgi:hypothetical protein
VAKAGKRSKAKLAAAKQAPKSGLPEWLTLPGAPPPGLEPDEWRKMRTASEQASLGLAAIKNLAESDAEKLERDRAVIDHASKVVFIPTAPEPAKAASIAKPKKSRKKSLYNGRQSIRARAVLKRMFPDGICPSRGELPNVDLLERFEIEFAAVEGKNTSRLKKPSDSVVLCVTGRK